MAGTHAVWIGALLLVGCGFEAPPTEEEMDGMDQPTDDPPITRNCAQGDTSLRLCIDFDDDTTLAGDGSSRGHDPALAAGLTMMTRDTELAVQMSSSSRLQIAEHADFDIASDLTISMWVKNEARPTSGAYWMLDNNNQYAMSLQSDGQVRCGLGADTVDSVASLDDSWHHVACTYDGNRLKVYIDGWVAGCRTLARPIAITGTEGLAIGSNIGSTAGVLTFTGNYVGGLDNVQVFARTWSDQELCAANGSAWCNSACPVQLSSGGRGDH